ncbi:MAG: four helix bundle suffix domain-containing protein [Bacteroidaceae bacterium]|nr:four helix bundle suffix domain-containing protein [Bacteroidaceae bacterium]
MSNTHFLHAPGDYHSQLFYKKAETLYDITYAFANAFFEKGDRTIDQMVQAARSGKQNIAEGIVDGVTSKEMMIKLFNVAKGSLAELYEDYADYLRVRRKTAWQKGSEDFERTYAFCLNHSEATDFHPLIDKSLAEHKDIELANLSLMLIKQTDYLIHKFLETAQEQFVAEGGTKEAMYAARSKWRDGNPVCHKCPVLPNNEPCLSCRNHPRNRKR